MKPFIGSELWVQPWHTADSIYDQMTQMKQYGLSHARIFLDWRHIEPQRGIFDFSLYDSVFDAAEKSGVKLQATLMHLNWLPRWRQKEIAQQGTLYDEEPENSLLRDIYVESVVQRYKDSPALDVWILANEPRLVLPKTCANLERFQKFVAELHTDPNDLYRLYGTNKADEIGYIKPNGSVELGLDEQWEFAGRIDWARMETKFLILLLHRTKTVLKKYDTYHLTTINPDDISKASLIEGGRNIWLLSEIVDFLGMSCHVAWHSTRFAENRIHQSVGMFCDMTRSATQNPEKMFQVTELQAGTNYFSGIRPTCPSPEALTRWIWDSIGSGAKGIVYWLLNPRDHGFEGLEWGLNNQIGKASKRTKASQTAKSVLDRLKGAENARPLPPEVYLLHDVDSLTLAILESSLTCAVNDKKDPRNSYLVADSLCGAYCLLWDMGYRIGFVNGQGIKSLPKGSMLIAPNVYAPSDETMRSVCEHVNNGGQLLVDGLFAVKDPYGNRLDSRDNMMSMLFGGRLEDFEVSSKPFRFSDENVTVSGFYLKGCFDANSRRDILARWEDDEPAAIRSGKCVYIATQLFQGYFANDKAVPETQDFVRQFLPERVGPHLKNPSPEICLRAMDSLIILTNSGKKTSVELILPESYLSYITPDGEPITRTVAIEEDGYLIWQA